MDLSRGLSYSSNPYMQELFAEARRKGIVARRILQNAGRNRGLIVTNYEGLVIFPMEDMLITAVGVEGYKGNSRRQVERWDHKYGYHGYISFTPVFPQEAVFPSIRRWLMRIMEGLGHTLLEQHEIVDYLTRSAWQSFFLVSTIDRQLSGLEDGIAVTKRYLEEGGTFPDNSAREKRLVEMALATGEIASIPDILVGTPVTHYEGLTLIADGPFLFLARGHSALEGQETSPLYAGKLMSDGYIKLDPILPQVESWLAVRSWVLGRLEFTLGSSLGLESFARALDNDFLLAYVFRAVYLRLTQGYGKLEKEEAATIVFDKAWELLASFRKREGM